MAAATRTDGRRVGMNKTMSHSVPQRSGVSGKRGRLAASVLTLCAVLGATLYMSVGTSNADEPDLIKKSIVVTNHGAYGLHVQAFEDGTGDVVAGDSDGQDAITINETEDYTAGWTPGTRMVIHFRAEAGKELTYDAGNVNDIPKKLCFGTYGTTIINFDVVREDCDTGERI
jgi:hypothetical protein